MEIKPGTVVKITYQLRTELNGDIVDEATIDAPFSFLYGHGNLLPKFEEYLADKVAGNHFSFILSAEEGYGVFDEKNIVPLSKEAFIWEGKLQEDLLVVGNVVPLQDNQGNVLQGHIIEIGENEVIVDLNHPLAGKELHFIGQVLAVREAHQSEIEHGHAHEDGHHHH